MFLVILVICILILIIIELIYSNDQYGLNKKIDNFNVSSSKENNKIIDKYNEDINIDIDKKLNYFETNDNLNINNYVGYFYLVNNYGFYIVDETWYILESNKLYNFTDKVNIIIINLNVKNNIEYYKNKI